MFWGAKAKLEGDVRCMGGTRNVSCQPWIIGVFVVLT